MNSLIISLVFNARRWASHCLVWTLLVLSLEPVDAFVPCKSRAVCVRNNANNQKQNRIPTATSLDLAITDEVAVFASTLALSLEPVAVWARSVTESYGTSLVNHPLTTKSLTAGLLCGISDVIAQTKQKNNNDVSYNIARTMRFASKGCLGGIVWMYWYEWIDHFLSNDSGVPYNSIWTGAILPTPIGESVQSFAQNHKGAVTTGISMVMEQFLWCPLVYGMFEIPLATLLNGGTLQSIPNEINTKLQGLLVSNAKVWTPANLLIYNAPLEWRLVLSNVMDVFWQSIVSDVAADCGGDDTIPEEGAAATETTTTTITTERPSLAFAEKK